jgi:hypothetical protein
MKSNKLVAEDLSKKSNKLVAQDQDLVDSGKLS